MNFGLADDNEFIKKLTELILANLEDEKFGAKELVLKTGMNHSTIHRRLKSIVGKNISQFICEIRLRKALDLLNLDGMTAAEVSYKVGFSSPAYFNNRFHKQFGYPPGEFKKRGSSGNEETSSFDLIELDNFRQKEVPAKTNRRHKLIARFTYGILLLIFLIFLIVNGSTGFSIFNMFLQPLDSEKSIAVLPFRNISNDNENQYFADGVMEEILNHLFNVTELRVISRTSVEQFRESNKTAPEIAKILGVKYVLEGSVQKYGNKVRVTIQLIDTKREQHIISKKFDREMSDIFNIQSEIAKQVASELQTSLSLEEIKKIDARPTQNLEAYNLYLLGRFYLNRSTENELKKSKDYFEKALIIDPNFTSAIIGLSRVHFSLAFFGWSSPSIGFGKAKELALTALKLDKNSAEAHSALGSIYCWSEWKWEEARKEYIKAIELKPNDASGYADYSVLLDILGEREKAREQINIALELAPTSPDCIYQSSWYYYNERKFDESLAGWQKFKEFNMNDIWAYMNCLSIYFWQDDGPKSIAELQKIFSKDTASLKYVYKVKQLYEQSGEIGLLNWLIDLELHKPNPSPIILANYYAQLGNKEAVLNHLEKAVKERRPWIPRIFSALECEFLHKDPRYIDMIKTMGLYNYFLTYESNYHQH